MKKDLNKIFKMIYNKIKIIGMDKVEIKIIICFQIKYPF